MARRVRHKRTRDTRTHAAHVLTLSEQVHARCNVGLRAKVWITGGYVMGERRTAQPVDTRKVYMDAKGRLMK